MMFTENFMENFYNANTRSQKTFSITLAFIFSSAISKESR